MTSPDRFVLLYERHHRRVFAYCLRRASADKAEEAVAETFLTAWRKIDDVPQDEEDALPWLFAVAYRVLGHQWRSASRYSRMVEKLSEVGVPPSDAPEDYIVVDQESRQVLDALGRLREKDQEILRLSIWEELSHSMIAQMLNMSEQSVRKRLSRARKSLALQYDRLEKRVPPLLAKEVRGDN